MINLDCTRRRNKLIIAPGARFDSLHIAEATQKFALGTILELDDATGRAYRYTKNGSSELAAHLMAASALIDAQQIGQIQSAYGVSVGENVFQILATTAHAITDGELKDGWLLVNDGAVTSMGGLYLINNNKEVTPGTDTVLEIELAEKIRYAILATDDISFIKNKFRDVIVTDQGTKTNSGQAIGVARVVVAADYYYWAQYRGFCGMIVDNGDSIIVNQPVGWPGTHGVDGTVGLVGTTGTDDVWGTLVSTPTGDEAVIVDLMLP